MISVKLSPRLLTPYMVLEVAVAAGASHIISFNLKHLKQASEFGIAVVKPSEFLKLL